MSRPASVVCLYEKKDRTYCSELHEHLAALQQDGLIDFWYPGLTKVGENIQQSLHQRLTAAQVILLLLSPGLIAREAEHVALALQRYEGGDARLIPIHTRPGDFGRRLASLQFLPRKGPLAGLRKNRDEAWAEIVREVRQLLEQIESAPSASNQSSKRYYVVLSGTFSEFDRSKVETMAEHLRTLTGDMTITIKAVKPGSIILVVEGTAAGMEKLKALEEAGEFVSVGGYAVMSVDGPIFNDDRPSPTEMSRQGLVHELSSYIDSSQPGQPDAPRRVRTPTSNRSRVWRTLGLVAAVLMLLLLGARKFAWHVPVPSQKQRRLNDSRMRIEEGPSDAVIELPHVNKTGRNDAVAYSLSHSHAALHRTARHPSMPEPMASVSLSPSTGGALVWSFGGPASECRVAPCELPPLPAGTKLRLTAAPDAGHYFKGWTEAGCTGTDPCEVTLTESDLGIEAQFAALVPLRVTAQGEGDVRIEGGARCGDAPCFRPGQEAKLHAVPRGIAQFRSWTLAACMNQNPCALRVPAAVDVQVAAIFAMPSGQLDLEVHACGQVEVRLPQSREVLGAGDYNLTLPQGSTVYLRAAPGQDPARCAFVSFEPVGHWSSSEACARGDECMFKVGPKQRLRVHFVSYNGPGSDPMVGSSIMRITPMERTR